MRVVTLAGCLFGVTLALSTGALAQNYNPAEAVSSSPLSATSCAKFVQLSHSERGDIVRRMVADAPGRSLTSSTITPDPNNSNLNDNPGNSSMVPGTPLTAGELIAACEASPSSTLRSAFTQFNSGGNMLTEP